MRLGVLDVGSNTVHLLLLDVYPGSRPEAFADHKVSLRLVQYLDEAGCISDEGRDALTAFVIEARDVAAEHEAEDLLAFATSAIREAGNGADVLDHVQSRSGVTLTEISGDQEAAVTFSAVRRWSGGARARSWIWTSAAGPSRWPSATTGFRRRRCPRPWAPGASRAASSRSTRCGPARSRPCASTCGAPWSRPWRRSWRRAPRISWSARQDLPLPGPHLRRRSSGAGQFVRRTMHLQDLRLWTRRMEAMTVQERSDLPGVSVNRAEQMLAGGIAAETAMDMLGVQSLTSARGPCARASSCGAWTGSAPIPRPS